MIGICDVSIQAATPNMPLYPLRAFVNSPSSLRIRNVPKKIGDWNISSVQLVVTYPDNTVKTVECKLVGSVWVGTVSGSSVTGKCENGYTVFASGNDENGNPVSNYALGKGLVEILEADTELKPGADIKYVRIFDEEPETPKDGDVWQISGAWYIYQDNQSWPIGDDSGLIGQLSSELSTAQQDIESLSANKLETSTFNNFKSDELTAYATQEWTNTQLATKQNTLTEQQLAAVNSGITAAKVVAYDDALTKFNYEFHTATKPDPYVPSNMFPIEYSASGETFTINESDSQSISIQYGGSNIYYLEHNNSMFDVRIKLCYINMDGTFSDYIDVNNVTFHGTSPTQNVTQIAVIPQGYVLMDRAVNTLNITPEFSTYDLTFPSAVQGKARDFIVRVVAPAWTYAPAPTLSASGVTLMNAEGTMPEIATDENAAKTTLVYFSEIAPNTFLVKGEALEAIS